MKLWPLEVRVRRHRPCSVDAGLGQITSLFSRNWPFFCIIATRLHSSKTLGILPALKTWTTCTKNTEGCRTRTQYLGFSNLNHRVPVFSLADPTLKIDFEASAVLHAGSPVHVAVFKAAAALASFWEKCCWRSIRVCLSLLVILFDGQRT